jgi:CHAT domain-containing protein
MRDVTIFLVIICFARPAFTQPHDIADANAIKNKADSLFNKKIELETAFKLYSDAEKVFKSLSQPVQAYSCANKRTEILWRQGRLNEAESLAEETYQQLLKLPDNDLLVLAGVCQNFGVIYGIKGDYYKSIQWHSNAALNLEKSERGTWKDFYTLYKYMSIAYKDGSEYTKAIEYGEKALKLLEKNTPDEKPELAVAHNNIGVPYLYLGVYPEALKQFNRSLSYIAPEMKSRYEYAAIYINNIAVVQSAMGQKELALSTLREGIDLFKKNFNSELISISSSAGYGSLTVNIGKILTDMGRVNQALPYLRESVTFTRKAYPDSKMQAVIDYYLALAHYKNGDLDSTYHYYDRADRFWKNRDKSKWDQEFFKHQFLNAVLLLKSQRIEESSKVFSELNNAYLDYVNYTFDLLSEYEREQLYNAISNHLEIYKNYAARVEKDYRGLMNLMLASKSILLKSSNRVKERIYASNDKVLIDQYAELQTLKQSYGKMLIDKLPKIQTDSVLNSINQLDKKLTQYSSIYKVENETPTWEKVLEKLDKREAALKIITIKEYDFDSLTFKDEIAYYALLLRKSDSNGPILIQFPDNGKILDEQLEVYRNSIQFKLEDNESYESFWGFLDNYLKKIDKVYLSVDGILNNVNFKTLKNPKTEKYLIEELQINRITNFESFLFTKEPTTTKVKTAILIGNPDFPVGIFQEQDQNERQLSLAEIPGTGEEINRINLLLESSGWVSEIYEREKATEESIKNIRRPSLLHIATHGFFLDDQTNSNDYRRQLFNSGLIFCDLPERSDLNSINDLIRYSNEGVLTSFEASELNINNTDLVVLSACETGLGSVRNGEGVYGLQRSIIAAGARSVMMSFWKVDDEKTKELMVSFYQNWLTGMEKRSSLRDVQLGMIEKGLHPYYWGSFVLLGE